MSVHSLYIYDFDVWLVLRLNTLVGASELFDKFVVTLVRSDIVKGGLVTGLLCYVWLVSDQKSNDYKCIFVRSIVGAIAAVAAGRFLQLTLPYTARPLHDAQIKFAPPATIKSSALSSWSSFPSDHAVLYFAVSTAVFLADRRIGIVAFLWTIVFTCIPRLYVGYHWPSDLIAGAIIGCVVMWLSFRTPMPTIVSRAVIHWREHHPASLYLFGFLVALQTATVFNDARRFLAFAANAILTR